MTADAQAPDGAAGGADARRDAVRDLEGAFSEMFGQMRRAYARAADRVSPGLLPGTFKVFTAVERSGPVSLSTLAERMDADKGLLSRAVSELEGLGLVERTADPHDGRVRLISTTAFGRERLDAVRYPYVDLLSDTLQDWPLASVRRLTALLQALSRGDTPLD